MEGFATSPWLFSCLLVTVSWISGHIGLLWLLSIVIVYLFLASFYTSCHIPKSWLQGWQNWREREHFVSSPYLDLAATWLLFTSLRNSGTIMIRQFVWTRISGMGEATLHFSLNLLQEIFPRESFRLKSALFSQTNSVFNWSSICQYLKITWAMPNFMNSSNLVCKGIPPYWSSPYLSDTGDSDNNLRLSCLNLSFFIFFDFNLPTFFGLLAFS